MGDWAAMPFMSSRPSGEANAAGPGQIFSHPHSKPFRPVPCLFTVSRSFIACLRTVSWLAAQCPRPTTRQIPTFPFLLSAPSFFVSSLTLPSHVVAMALKATAVAAILAMLAASAAAQTCTIISGESAVPAVSLSLLSAVAAKKMSSVAVRPAVCLL